MNKDKLLIKVKTLVRQIEPGSTIILFGSHSRGDNHKSSDIDLLILVKKEKITWEDARRISYPLYGLGLETGELISVIVKTKKEWQSKYRVTPFYQDVQKEGIVL